MSTKKNLDTLVAELKELKEISSSISGKIQAIEQAIENLKSRQKVDSEDLLYFKD